MPTREYGISYIGDHHIVTAADHLRYIVLLTIPYLKAEVASRRSTKKKRDLSEEFEMMTPAIFLR